MLLLQILTLDEEVVAEDPVPLQIAQEDGVGDLPAGGLQRPFLLPQAVPVVLRAGEAVPLPRQLALEVLQEP